jgi:hypothetical protein
MGSDETDAAWGGKKLGAYLLATALIGWMITTPTIEFSLAHYHGFGSGFGDGGRIPPEVVRMYGTDDRATLVKETMGTGTADRHNPFEGSWAR